MLAVETILIFVWTSVGACKGRSEIQAVNFDTFQGKFVLGNVMKCEREFRGKSMVKIHLVKLFCLFVILLKADVKASPEHDLIFQT
jgi:extradiol dioxygenase family protein